MPNPEFAPQTCRCGAKASAKELSKGHREFREFIVIGYLDKVNRPTLCVTCEVILNLLLEGDIRRLAEFIPNHEAMKRENEPRFQHYQRRYPA
jgi:hypothetical protein